MILTPPSSGELLMRVILHAIQAQVGETMTATTRFRLRGKPKDSYLALVLAFPLASIRDEDHLAAARQILDRLLAESELDEGAALYLDALSDLVGAYEDKHHPIPPPSDAEMLQHLLEAKGLTQSALHRDTGIPKNRRFRKSWPEKSPSAARSFTSWRTTSTWTQAC
jgi:HTH-type transcriptional regulator/antitoxin HigA